MGVPSCGREATAADVVADYAASWIEGDAAVRTTLTGPGTEQLVRRIAVVRPHLSREPRLVGRRHLARGRFEGVVVLPMAGGAELRLAIAATVVGGRVRAEPKAFARPLRAWPVVAMERTRVPRGRLLDRLGAPLDATRDAPLLATVSPVFRSRLGGGRSYRLTGDGSDLAVVDAPPASDVTLALDPTAQAAADAALAGGRGRALVAIDAATGQVVAFAGGRTGGRAIAATALPVGSVFKIATATAALNADRSPEDQVDCPAADVVEGRPVVNASSLDIGRLSLRRAFALSCNTSFARLGADLGGDRLRAAAVALGFTGRLAGTEAGTVDHAESGEAAAALGFGASGVEATPVALASVAATLANGGEWRQPTWEVQAGRLRRAVPAPVAATLVAMMRDAVENGTARRAAVPGVDVAAKTGTPRRLVDGVAIDDGVTVAAVRSGDRVLGVAVAVLEGGRGGRSAAPLIADFVRRLPPG